jgi:hypothetical protein
MQESDFWRIVDDASREGDPYEGIKSRLCDLSRQEILSFHHIFTKALAAACSFPLLAANFAIASYVSDDGFREFRAWLISQGSDKFGRALIDPESIADWLDKDCVDGIDGAPMLAVAQDAYIETYGDDDDFLQRATFEPDPRIVQDWPENKAEYRRKWPKLVAKYWNAERIREMHSD